VERILARREALIQKVEADRAAFADKGEGYLEAGKVRLAPENELRNYHLKDLKAVNPDSAFAKLLELPQNAKAQLQNRPAQPGAALPTTPTARIVGNGLRQEPDPLNLNRPETVRLHISALDKDTIQKVFTIVPSESDRREVVFRFSEKLGLVDADDLAGVPYYILIEDLKTVPKPEPVDPKKKLKPVYGIFVNIPGRLRSTLNNTQGIIATDEFPAGQFGNVELLSGALFNKRYTTRLRLNPLSGAVNHLDAELPK
jgi:hypothetical protein